MFDLEKYRAGEVEVYCDSCGNAVDLHKTIATRVIGKDADGREVTEQYFTCDCCGRHYTIAVIDTQQRKLIQERKQLQRQIRLFAQIGADQKIKQLQRKETRLKNVLMKRSAQLKERWEEEL